jgi:hypothetical protein
LFACRSVCILRHIRLFFSECTYEVLAGEKRLTGQTASLEKVILSYRELKYFPQHHSHYQPY